MSDPLYDDAEDKEAVDLMDIEAVPPPNDEGASDDE